MECKSPYFDYISNCTDTVVVNANLDPTTSYQWLIEDKFGNQYSGAFTSDSDGNFEIPVEDLPEGLLNSYGGEFSLKVVENYSCREVSLNMKASYDAILFQVKAGTRVKDNLGCE